MSTEPLHATCWTIAGDAAPDRTDRRSPIPLRERVEAASAAGFASLGLLMEDLREATDRYGVAGVRSLLDDNGVELREVELLTDWWTEGAVRRVSDQARYDMLAAAETFGIHHIKIGPDVANGAWQLDEWAAEFATLAEEADGVGARLAIEFLPWANVRTLHDGLRLVETAGHPAGGLIIDAWHIERGRTTPADLGQIPLDRIVGVELNDARAEQVGSMFEDTVHRRLLCGHGDFDLHGLVAALRQAGWRGPWGVEILSDEHRQLDVMQAARVAARSTHDLLGTTGH